MLMLRNHLPLRHNDQMALRDDGTVVMWGALTNVPSSITNAVAIAANWYDAAAILGDGSVEQWGASTYSVPSATDMAHIALGYDYGLGLRSNGVVIAWGQPTWRTDLPSGLNDIVSVAAGANHSVAVRSDGTVASWGLALDSLGWNLTNLPSGLDNGYSVDAGMLHSLVLNNDGTVFAWGHNADGQTNVPTGLSNVVQVSAGMSHSLALREDGTLSQWGTLPSAPLDGLTNAVAIASGGKHSLAIRQGILTPLIVEQPQDEIAKEGDGVSFSVHAASLAPPVYQWYFGANPLEGATSNSLTLNDVSSSDSGDYSVLVTNGAGSVWSRDVTFTLATAPVILYPTNLLLKWLVAGAIDVLHPEVDAPGQSRYPLGYYWQRDGVPQTNVTMAMYTFGNANLSHEGDYVVTVSNELGTATSGT